MNINFKIIKPHIIQENMMSNPDLIKQFLTLYQSQIPLDFQALKQAIMSENLKEIANKAHHIKPTMLYIGANQQQHKLQQIENQAGLNNRIEIQSIFSDLEKDMDEMMIEIEMYLNKL